jgi:cytochrome c2
VIRAAPGSLVLLALLPFTFTFTLTHAAADPARGERVFQRCYACHSVAAGEDRLPGPSLRCLLGRRAGTLAGFEFSPAMVEAGAAGQLVWTRATLDAFLVDPQSLVPGTVMWIPSLSGAEDRRDVIDYLERAGACPAETSPPAARP